MVQKSGLNVNPPRVSEPVVQAAIAGTVEEADNCITLLLP
jgi:hypothetical protein